MHDLAKKKGVVALATAVAIVLAIFVPLNLHAQSTNATSLTANSKDAREQATTIALADTKVQSLIDGKKHRVVSVAEGNREEGENFDVLVGIYVYPHARYIRVPVDLVNNEVVDVLVNDNSIGPMPTPIESYEAYLIASADQRFLDMAAGRIFTYHPHQIVKLSPDDPCHTHRCISISLDIVENDSSHTTHQAVAFVDMVNNQVTGFLTQTNTMDLIAPANANVQILLNDYEGRKISSEEAKQAVNLFLQD